MWRRLVVRFIVELNSQVNKPIVVPMTLVNPNYLSEIFGGLGEANLQISHFYLRVDRATLVRRMQNQIMFPEDRVKDQEVRRWRLEQVDRCLCAAQEMPLDTVFLNSQEDSPNQLLEQVLSSYGQK